LSRLPEDDNVLEQLTIHTVENLDEMPALIWFFKAQSLPNCKEDLIMNLAISFSNLPYIAIYPGEAQLYPPYPE